MAQAITTTETNDDTLNIVVKPEKNQTPQEALGKMTGYKNPEANDYIIRQLYAIVTTRRHGTNGWHRSANTP